MAERPLSPDEAALWARVLETVRPMRAAPKPALKVMTAKVSARTAAKAAPAKPMAPDADMPGGKAGGRTAGTFDTHSLFERLIEMGVGGEDQKRGGAPAPKRPTSAMSGSTSREPANTLDGSWDKKLSRGMISPDCSIDLHGHNLATAYATLDGALEQSIRMGDRVILLVTGKPPRPASERPHARGAIRAAIGDWLAGSRHASAIAAVRGAHPRHGGAGAMYIILRKGAARRDC